MALFTVKHAFDLALQRHREGRLQEAEQLYREILAQQPEHADALHYLGVIALQAGRSDVAVDLIGRAIALDPNSPEAHVNLGLALKSNGQFDAAIAAYRHAIALRPTYAEAHNNLGNALKHTGQLDEAISAYRNAIESMPNLPETLSNLGNALQERGQLDEAILTCRQAIYLRANLPEAHNHLGTALLENGELDGAIAAYRHAISLRPNFAEAHCSLANALATKGHLDEAIAACRRAIGIRPDFPEAYTNLGKALAETGQFDEAIGAYRQAIALKPTYSEAHSGLVYLLHFHPAWDAPAIAEEHRRWNVQHAEPLRKFIQPHNGDRNPERRLRIGYVSPDFRDHVVGRNLLPLFRNHDRRQFEVTCYAQVRCPDAMTSEFHRNADCWRNIVGRSDEQVASQIREDRIDILVDTTLHMAHNRLLVFARKPATIQVTFAGYPGSTGVSTIDYRLSDPHLDPSGSDESIYSERTIRLPDTFWCYDPLEIREMRVNSLPALQNGIVTFGCLANFRKVNEGILALWAQVLRRVEGSRLLLLAHPGSHRQRTTDLLHREGIDAARVEFAPPQKRRGYLELYHRVDLSLDSFPYNGHTSDLDSFWMGAPVVTLVGSRAVSRAGWSQAANLGLTELAAHNAEQFVRVCEDLANDLPRLCELRSTLRQRMERSPLMDAPRFARNIELAYRRMWQDWCAANSTPPAWEVRD